MSEKIFTLEEVEELIPLLEETFKEIRIQRKYLAKISSEITRAASHSESNGGTPYGPAYIKTMEILNQKIETIQKKGVLIQDIDRGLCDFPYISNGRTVYLCWKSGEPSLRWWHEIEKGFAGREKLEKLQD